MTGVLARQGPATFRAICRETWRESFVFGKPAPAYLTIKGIAEGMKPTGV